MSQCEKHDAEKVRNAIASFLEEKFLFRFNEKGIDGSTNLFKENVIDSFGLIELITFLEQSYSIQFTEEDLTSPLLGSLNGLLALVTSKLI
jgi:acyl carrier protein